MLEYFGAKGKPSVFWEKASFWWQVINTITNKDITQALLKIFTIKILYFRLALVNINFIVHSTNIQFQHQKDT